MHYKGLFKLFKHFDSHFYKIISQNLMRFFQNFCDIQNCVYGPLTNQMEKFAFEICIRVFDRSNTSI